MLVQARNPKEVTKEKTYLSRSVNAGDAEIKVLNNDGFTADDYVIIESIGSEQAELRQVATVTGGETIVLTSPLSHSHGTDAVVSIISYNQVEFSRKTSSSGAYTVLATVDVQPDGLFTNYEDRGGQLSYFYRFRFVNSTVGQYTDYSAIRKGTGATSREVSRMIDMILLQSEDPSGTYTTRNQALEYLNQAYEEVSSRLIQASSEYFLRKIEIPTKNFQNEYSLPDDFREIQEIRDADDVVVKPIPRNMGGEFSRGYELVGLNKVYINDIPTESGGSPTTVFLNDAYDEDGSWVASLDATNVTTDTDEFKVGTGSINFDVDVSLDASNSAALTNSTFTDQDLSTFEDVGKWRIWTYIPDVTYFSSVTLRWGSDASNYWELTVQKDYKGRTFQAGDNLLEFNWADTSVTETGTADSEAIGYLQVKFNYTSRQSDLEDFRLDGITIATSYPGNSVYEVSYLRQPDRLRNEMDEVELPLGYANLLVDYAIAQIMFRKGDRDITAQNMLKRWEERVAKFIAESSKRTRRVIGFSLDRDRGYYTRQYNVVTRDSDFVVRKV